MSSTATTCALIFKNVAWRRKSAQTLKRWEMKTIQTPVFLKEAIPT